MYVVLVEPSLFAEPWPLAFQFQEHILFPLPLSVEPVPTEKPSEPKAVNSPVLLSSALVKLDEICLLAPLTASVKIWFQVAERFFPHIKSGWKPTPVIDCAEPVPV